MHFRTDIALLMSRGCKKKKKKKKEGLDEEGKEESRLLISLVQSTSTATTYTTV